MSDERDDGRWAGAPQDEQFEATLAAEAEPFDSRTPHVMTLLGAIAPAALGPTVFTTTWPLPGSAPEVAVAELEAAYALGVRAVAFLATECDERADERRWIAARSPVHLVAPDFLEHVSPATGTGRRDPDVITADAAPGADAGLHELADLELPRQAIRVVTVTPRRAQARADATPTGAVLYAVVMGAAGTIYEGAAAWLRDRWHDGQGERLLAGFHDDPVTLMERLPLALMAAGLPALAVRRILVDNPMAALTISPASEG